MCLLPLPRSVLSGGIIVTESELFTALADKPALRHAIARTPEEAAEALKEYRRTYYGNKPGEDEWLSLIRTADVRAELLELVNR